MTTANSVRTYLEQRALIISAMLQRAGAEIALKQIELPPGEELIARQLQNTFLRERGLWDKLEPHERALATVADREWSLQDTHLAADWCEQLRLLRWVLGVDSELTPLAHEPRLDFKLPQKLLQEPYAVSGGATRASWELRADRTVTSNYLVRAVAELKLRGLIEYDRATEPWVEKVRRDFGDPSRDMLAGVQAVGELSDQDLWILNGLAGARCEYAEYLMEQLDASEPMRFSEWEPRSS